MYDLLDKINRPSDIKGFSIYDLNALAAQIREFLVRTISKTGGHFASNLGVVELTIALHYCFDTPRDKIIWDVGHQVYVHKILTGRKSRFDTLRTMNGLSGFPKPSESVYDAYGTGHASTSISAALGFAKARDLNAADNKVIAVIGDGSMTGGLAYEGLNNAGRSNTDIIVILNDNDMSIGRNVGALSKHLSDIRSRPGYIGVKRDIQELILKIPVFGEQLERSIKRAKNALKYVLVNATMFEELGFQYIGPIDGHDIASLLSVMNNIKNMHGPVLLHVFTKKGKGYKYAEKKPSAYHGVTQFDIRSGKPCAVRDDSQRNRGMSRETKQDSTYERNRNLNPTPNPTYSQVFGEHLAELARTNTKIVAITAAMVSGTGLDHFFKKYPNRAFDVGIAESHAVTFASGLATESLIPVVAIYSSFLQRSFDQIIHDVAIPGLHVLFVLDRAGVVDGDGETHQGIFDLSFLSIVPGLVVMSPKNKLELTAMLDFAVNQCSGPVAIRYPKAQAGRSFNCKLAPIELGKWEMIRHGQQIAIIFTGDMSVVCQRVASALMRDGLMPTIINARFIAPLDNALIIETAQTHNFIFTIEENILDGGLGQRIADNIQSSGISDVRLLSFGLPKEFLVQGTRTELLKHYQLDDVSITQRIKWFMNGEKNG